jgi:hypothetical protein
MVPDIQKISTASAFVAPPGILAATLRALTGFLLFTFINICMERENIRKHTHTHTHTHTYIYIYIYIYILFNDMLDLILVFFIPNSVSKQTRLVR